MSFKNIKFKEINEAILWSCMLFEFKVVHEANSLYFMKFSVKKLQTFLSPCFSHTCKVSQAIFCTESVMS